MRHAGPQYLEAVLIKLAEELGGTGAPRHVRTVTRWRKEWREDEQLNANLGILVDELIKI